MKGLAYMGALAELSKHFRFQVFVGTSAGAITAVLLASGYDASEVLEIALNTDFKDFLDPIWLWPLNLVRYRALNSGRALEFWLKNLLDRSPSKQHVGEVEMRHLINRCIVYASSRRAPTMRYDSDGERRDAPAAFAAKCSASVPLFFAAELEYGRPIVDGGLRNNFPLDDFVHTNGQNFVALYLRDSESRSYGGQVLSILTNEQRDTVLVKKYEDRTIAIDPSPIAMLDLSLTNEAKQLLILRGRAAAKAFLADRMPALSSTDDVRVADQKSAEMASVVRRQRTRRRVVRITLLSFCFATSVVMVTVPWGELKTRFWHRVPSDVAFGKDPTKLPDPEPDPLVGDLTGRTLELTPMFLENYEDRATIIAQRFAVDKVSRLHAPQNGGDLAFVGRTPFIRLITRARVMNGAMHRELIAFLDEAAEAKAEINVVGAWRIWFSHPDGLQVQGAPEPSPDESNPAHFLELIPVLTIGERDLSDTFVPVAGYEPYLPERAFPTYEQVRCTIVTDRNSGRRRITVSRPIGYNFAVFTLRAIEEPRALRDGHSVVGAVEDAKGHTLVDSLRVIGVRDTPPDYAITQLRVGNRLRLTGIPRLSLKAIRAASDGERKLPYEMIAAAVLSSEASRQRTSTK